jgi:hypothetical protein
MNKRAQTLAKGHRELRNYSRAIGHGTAWLGERVREDDPAEYRSQLTIDGYLLERALVNPDDVHAMMKCVGSGLANHVHASR